MTTQMVDRDDPISGFVHRWLLEFSNHFEYIDVVCLKKGSADLPPNIRVYSLGKEGGVSRSKYIWKFYYYTFRSLFSGERPDAVFIHQNPHYMVLAGWLWRLFGIPAFFFRNHARWNRMTALAAFFSVNVFHTSPFACTARYKHSVQMPVGIDPDYFKEVAGVTRKKKSVLFLGRHSTVKRPEIFIKAANLLNDFEIAIYGDDIDRKGEYLTELKALAAPHVKFYPAVTNDETPEIYSTYDYYVNLTPEGSMDKTVPEAAACRAIVVVANTSFEGLLPELCLLKDPTPESLAARIRKLEALPDSEKNTYRDQLRAMVIGKHSVKSLALTLKQYILAAKQK